MIKQPLSALLRNKKQIIINDEETNSIIIYTKNKNMIQKDAYNYFYDKFDNFNATLMSREIFSSNRIYPIYQLSISPLNNTFTVSTSKGFFKIYSQNRISYKLKKEIIKSYYYFQKNIKKIPA